jgi:glycosyltransferase involved in cell wall biosynthesis
MSLNTKNNKPHILFLTKWYPNKNDIQLGVFIQKHAKAVAQYCKLNVLYVWGDYELKENYQIVETSRDNFKETIIYYKRNKGLLKSIINPFLYLKYVLHGFNKIQNEKGKINLIHVHILIRTGVAALLLKTKYKTPFILSEQWTGYTSKEYEQFSFFRKIIIRLIIKNAKAVAVVSESLKQNMLKHGLKNNYHIIHNIIENINLPEKNTNTKTKILTVADLNDKNKNISSTIKAMHYVSSLRNDFEFHIIGGGTDENKLKVLAKDLGLLDNILFFHGRQSNDYVYDFFKKIDFVIINSNVETFCVAAAEALVNGKPQITTICGGPEEFVKQEHGILIEKGNQTQLEAAIIKMLNTYKNYDALEMHKYAKKYFSYEKIGKDFYNLYQNILEQ